MSSPLFDPYTLGPYSLNNRMVMAPLTRSRSAQPGNIPTRLNAFYYAQRASAGLIVSEATQVSQQGQGYAWTPGIHTPEQVAGWKLVTEAVHAAGSRIFLQLWHVGRVSHPALQPDGGLPVAPSAIGLQGMAFITDERGAPQFVPFVTPRALGLEEIPGIVGQYEQGARNALAAGFDGVEVHAANGYLIDQFLNSSTNRRTDDYGGSISNRSRLLMEIVEEVVCGVWGSDRVGVRISPEGTFNDMGDEDPEALFRHVAARLNDCELAYLHVVQPEIAGNATIAQPDPTRTSIVTMIRGVYHGTLIACGGYDYRRATRALEIEGIDLIAFGRLFLANPDLPGRLRQAAPLNKPDEATFYGGGATGYIDYPTLRQQRGEERMPDFARIEKDLLGAAS